MTHWIHGEKMPAARDEPLRQRLARLRRAMHALEEEAGVGVKTTEAPPAVSAKIPTSEAPDDARRAPRQPAPTNGGVRKVSGDPLLAKTPTAEKPPSETSTEEKPALKTPAVETPAAKTEAADAEHFSGEAEPGERVALLLARISQPDNLISATERRLALDTLGLLLSRIPQALQKQVVDRLCVMERPPRPLLEAALRALPEEHAARLLTEAHLSDAFLADVVRTGNALARKCVLRRRRLGPATCMALAETAPVEILGRLLRHTDAALSEGAWRELLARAMQEPALRPLLVRHAALPPPEAHELFWHLSSDQRAALLARAVGQSRLLEELLNLAQAPGRMPARAFLETMEVAIGAVIQHDAEGAVATMATATGMRLRTIRRIFEDEGGEAMAILFKGHRVPGHTFLQTLRDHAQGSLGRRWAWLREHDRLMDFYGGVGTARARVMLLYWDWRSRGCGPYAAYPPLAGR